MRNKIVVCAVIFVLIIIIAFVITYTKIGHIENIENLGDNNITIKFEK